MKDFKEYLKEASIRGSEGIPGESQGEDEKYLDEVEKRAREKVGAQSDDRGSLMGRPSEKTQRLLNELWSISRRNIDIIRNKKVELEELAKNIILAEYGDILQNVDLDIKLVTSGSEIKDFLNNEDSEQDKMPSFQLLNDPEIKKEVDKRKIQNNITQGEAKNTKRILSLPDIKDKLEIIFSKEIADRLLKDWKRTTDLADRLDWIVPVEVKGEMIEQAPQGLAGAVSVKWPEMEEDNEEKAKKILSDETDEDSDILDDNKEEISDMLDHGNPIIKARGVDFPMLLHETVKGIYELIAAAGIPEDKRTAELVMLNTSSGEDEAEEFRFGPEIAADIRDFINEIDGIDKYPNMREYFYGKLAILPADEFLLTVKNILLNSELGRKKSKEIIDEIIKELDEWELGEAIPGERDEPSYEVPETEEEEEDIDYSKLSQKEIQGLIDDALDSGDFGRVKELSDYLKEGKEIYLNELKRINENKPRRK